MTLAEMENLLLLELQQPGAVAFGSTPTWSALTNPQVGQAMVDFAINQAYIRLMGDLNEYRIGIVTMTFPSVANAAQSGQVFVGYPPGAAYNVPPPPANVNTTATGPISIGLNTVNPVLMNNIVNGQALCVNAGLADQEIIVPLYPIGSASFNAVFALAHTGPSITLTGVNWPDIGEPIEVYYTPTGLQYTQRYGPGSLISFEEFNAEYTGQGYWGQQSYGTQPDAVTFSPDLTQLLINPPSIVNTDTIQILYSPIPTVGATLCPTLVNPNDEPLLPDNCHQGIIEWACYLLWRRERQEQMARDARDRYAYEVKSIQEAYSQLFVGDSQAFREKRNQVAGGRNFFGF